MYADDSTLTAQAKTTPELNETLNGQMALVSDWCGENHMVANETKTKGMLVTTWQKRISMPESDRELSVHMNGLELENVSSEKLLGVIVNKNLSWEEHIDSMVSKINRKLALLRRIKGCLPIESRKMFANTHILPYLDYCSAWQTFS